MRDNRMNIGDFYDLAFFNSFNPFALIAPISGQNRHQTKHRERDASHTSHKPTSHYESRARTDYFRIADYSGVGKRHQRTWPWQRLSLVTDAETLQLTLKSDSRGNARVHYQSRGVFATLTA